MTVVNSLDMVIDGKKYECWRWKDQDTSPGWPTWEVLGLAKVYFSKSPVFSSPKHG